MTWLGLIFVLALFVPVDSQACHKDDRPHGPNGSPCDDPPPPPGEDDPPSEMPVWVRWLPSGENNMTAAEESWRPCSPTAFGNNGGQYHCEHQSDRNPVYFDFSSVAYTQTKRNGDDRLCEAMSGISIVANSSYQLYWEGSCKGPDGCDIYSEQWFNGSDVQSAVAAFFTAEQNPPHSVDFIRLKPEAHVTLVDSNDDANPYANGYTIVMETATVRFIKAGSNRDAAVCVYDWEVGFPDPLLFDTTSADPTTP
jgi:hypothetical protein